MFDFWIIDLYEAATRRSILVGPFDTDTKAHAWIEANRDGAVLGKIATVRGVETPANVVIAHREASRAST